MYKYIVIIALIFNCHQAMAQEVVSSFDGKYGVFIAVALVVLVGIFAYLIHLERKIRKLERQQQEEES